MSTRPSNAFIDSARPISEDVADELRAEILSGKLKPGDRLVERQIARDSNVSRQPVHDALKLLERRGLVEQTPSKGMVVARLDPKDLDDLFVVRESLEVLAARLACINVARGADIDPLRRLLDENSEALAAGDDEAAFGTNAEFHAEILRLADNKMLASMLNPLLLRMHRLSGGMRDLDVVHAEHVDLYEAIGAGDLKTLDAAARNHANRLSARIKDAGLSED